MSRSHSIFVSRAKTPQERDACFSIRFAVFCDEQKFNADTEIDEYDDKAIQLLASQNGKPVGTARVLVNDGGQTLKIGRVAVLKQMRGSGIGQALMLAVEDLPEANNAAKFELSSQIQAIPFYERVGYAVEGDEYIEDGAPHCFMIKKNPHHKARKQAV